MESKVSLVKSKEHYQGTQEALIPLKEDIEKAISKIRTLVIKVNMVITTTPRHPHGVDLAITPVETVQSFVDFIAPFYGGKIIIIEEACWGNTKVGFDLYGYGKFVSDYSNIELLDMKDDDIITKRIAYSQGELILPFSKTMLEAPFLVSMTRPKVHCNVAMTAGIKNVVVGAVEGYKYRKGLHRKKDLHEVLAVIAQNIFPHLVIIDGVVGMEESGPIQGKEIQSGWTLASLDALAADSLTAYLMDFEVKGIPYLGMIREFGLGRMYPTDRIEILGENPDHLVTHYKPYRKFTNDLKKQKSQ